MATAATILDTGEVLIQQTVDEELGNSAYLVVDRRGGVAAVIDPPRDADRVLRVADSGGWRIACALDTHVHNDFVSGGPDLRVARGSTYVVPTNSDIRGADLELVDGDELELGSLRLRAVHSPGHTPEHLSYLVVDHNGVSLALLSGGALMVGTMARPDLLGPSHTFGLSRSGRATMTRLMHDFSDDLLVLPTHGGGSFCGAAATGERVTTIGTERRTNPLARTRDLAHFLALHTAQGEYPAYYQHMALRNRLGRPLLGGAAPAVRRVSPADVDAAQASGSVVVDCRPHDDFDQAHIPDAVSVPLHGPFSPWVGWVIDITASIVLVARSADEAEEATRQLIRIGFTDVGRWLDLSDWVAETRAVRSLRSGRMADLAESLLDGEAVTVVDVRQEREWAAGHIPGAVHALPDAMLALAATVDTNAPVAVHCASGHRSSVAVSLLLQAGITDIWHIIDGPDAWQELGHPLVSAA